MALQETTRGKDEHLQPCIHMCACILFSRHIHNIHYISEHTHTYYLFDFFKACYLIVVGKSDCFCMKSEVDAPILACLTSQT